MSQSELICKLTKVCRGTGLVIMSPDHAIQFRCVFNVLRSHNVHNAEPPKNR